MATSTRASKNDQRTTLLFVLSLTVRRKKKKQQFKTNLKVLYLVTGTEQLHINLRVTSLIFVLCQYKCSETLQSYGWAQGLIFLNISSCAVQADVNLTFGHKLKRLSVFCPPSKRPTETCNCQPDVTCCFKQQPHFKVSKWGISNL